MLQPYRSASSQMRIWRSQSAYAERADAVDLELPENPSAYVDRSRIDR